MAAIKKICIDPGHGGTDPGAVNGALTEKYVNLEIALELKRLLVDKGFKVYMTREGDVFETPLAKAKKANAAGADIFISIHCNSSADAQAEGTETLCFDGGGECYNLAKAIQESLVSLLKLRDRGVKIRPELTVLNSTKMPAVLIETAFISNGKEKKLLMDSAFRKKAAKAICEGLCVYLGMGDESMTLEEAKKIVKEKYGFDENTMEYLEFYRFSESLILRLAQKVK